jgi:hypothetical protein
MKMVHLKIEEDAHLLNEELMYTMSDAIARSLINPLFGFNINFFCINFIRFSTLNNCLAYCWLIKVSCKSNEIIIFAFFTGFT